MVKYLFYLKGLHCSSCVYATEKALLSIPRIKKALVSLADGQVLVEAEEEIDFDLIKKEIGKLGYQIVFNNQQDLVDSFTNKKKIELRRQKIKTFLGIIFSSILVLATFPKLNYFVPPPLKNIWLQFLLATMTQFYLGYDFYFRGLINLKSLRANMDTLVVIGTTSAYFYSLFSVFFPSFGLEPYFDVSVVIITFVLLGRYVEEKAKLTTGQAIKKLIELSPKQATVLIRS